MNIFYGLFVGLLLVSGKFLCFSAIGSADAILGYPLGSYAAGGIHRLGPLKTHYGLAKLGLLKMGHIGFKKFGLLGAANPNYADDSEEVDENMHEEESPEVGAHMWTVPRHIYDYEGNSPAYEGNSGYREATMEPEMTSYYDNSQYRSHEYKSPTHRVPTSYGRKPHYSKGREMETEQPYNQEWSDEYTSNYGEHDAVLGEMGPQIPQNARTLYVGNLFGLLDGVQRHSGGYGGHSGGHAGYGNHGSYGGYGHGGSYSNHGNYDGHRGYSGHGGYSEY